MEFIHYRFTGLICGIGQNFNLRLNIGMQHRSLFVNEYDPLVTLVTDKYSCVADKKSGR
ncbi:hypothetical protein SDC9_158748 [bioreactor metagenome]|uniref:Uncharacterized protein n=1 Tax=bioreactor metagenome TaxID=1076179 RepID=A0A645FB15_9ZZZZ